MKKILMAILVAVLCMPVFAFAKEKDDKKVDIYIFYGDGCPHCHKAFEFFDSIEEEYGKYYNIKKYETWYSTRNNKLMYDVAQGFSEDTEKLGVPYIIIGDKTFVGYTEDYNDGIKEAIVNAYNKGYKTTAKDIVQKWNNDFYTTLTAIGVSVLVCGIVVIINVLLRKKVNS